MPLIIVLSGIALLLILIAYFKLDAFISFVIVSIYVGLAEGMDVTTVTASVQKGIGDTLGFLAIILGFGAMLGKLVAESGAAQRITTTMTEAFGKKNIQWALVLTGFIVGIPMFYSVGFVILVPLVFTVAATTKLPMIYIGLPMLSALSVTHGYLPPHPAPSFIATSLNADIGMTLVYGIIVAIPAIILGGPVFSSTLKKYNPKPLKLFTTKILTEQEMPGIWTSILTALLPVIMLALTALLKLFVPSGSAMGSFLNFAGDPVIAMLITVLIAAYTLGIRQGRSIKEIMKIYAQAIQTIATILLIIGGAGSLKQILVDSGVSLYIADLLRNIEVSPLILTWAIAASIRVCVGSATVAGLTTVGIVLPLIEQLDANPCLMTLATGAGSLMFSHVNDSGFWLFKEYFNLTVKETFLTWSIMETIVSVTGLAGTLVLSYFV